MWNPECWILNLFDFCWQLLTFADFCWMLNADCWLLLTFAEFADRRTADVEGIWNSLHNNCFGPKNKDYVRSTVVNILQKTDNTHGLSLSLNFAIAPGASNFLMKKRPILWLIVVSDAAFKAASGNYQDIWEIISKTSHLVSILNIIVKSRSKILLLLRTPRTPSCLLCRRFQTCLVSGSSPFFNHVRGGTSGTSMP
jgi:hypothetical protein